MGAGGAPHLKCGRYRNQLSFNQMQARAEKAAATSNAQPNLDTRPTTQQRVVRAAGGETELTKMRWGPVPFWAGGKALTDFKLPTFNAKADTVATAATFKGRFKIRRCLVIADGWYEWTGAKGAKERRLFTPKDGEPLTFGGLWDRCKSSDIGEIKSFTIVTQPTGAPSTGTTTVPRS